MSDTIFLIEFCTMLHEHGHHHGTLRIKVLMHMPSW